MSQGDDLIKKLDAQMRSSGGIPVPPPNMNPMYMQGPMPPYNIPPSAPNHAPFIGPNGPPPFGQFPPHPGMFPRLPPPMTSPNSSSSNLFQSQGSEGNLLQKLFQAAGDQSRGQSPAVVRPEATSAMPFTSATPPSASPLPQRTTPPPSTATPPLQAPSQSVQTAAPLNVSQGSVRSSPIVTKQRKKEEPPGTRIFGKNVSYDIEHPSTKKREIESTGIAMYQSDHALTPGTLIGTNMNFICYTVKGDIIRVLSKKTGARGLLKGHSSPITDLSFFAFSTENENANQLLTCGADGKVIIWRLNETPEAIKHEILLSVDAKEPVKRGLWHPTDSTHFATAQGSKVYIWNRILSQEDATSYVEIDAQFNVLDISFSFDGSELAVATTNNLQIWKWKENKTLIKELDTGNRITNIIHGDKFLISGLSNGGHLKIWNTSNWECTQNFTFKSTGNNIMNHIALDPKQHAFVFVANAKRELAYALHLSTDENGDTMFDYITEFNMTTPVISFIFTISDHTGLKASPFSPSSLELQVYCLQTKAIQVYHLFAEQAHSSESIDSPALTQETEDHRAEIPITNEEQKEEVELQPPVQSPTIPVKELVKEIAEEAVSVAITKPDVPKTSPTSQRPSSPPKVNLELLTPSSFESEEPKTPKGASAEDKTKGDEARKPSPQPNNRAKGKKQKQEQTTKPKDQSPSPNDRKKEPQETETKKSVKFSLSTETPNDILIAMESIMERQMEALYQRLERERKERENLERQRQERLLSVISETLNTNMSQQMEAIIHKELQNFIVPALGKTLVQTLENSLLKPLQENFQKILAQNLTPKIETTVKEGMGKLQISKQFSGELAKTLSSSIKQSAQEAFLSYFQESFIPAMERSVQSMFRQLNTSFEKGLSEKLSQTDLSTGPRSVGSSDTIVLRQLQTTVESLLEISNTMTKTIVDTQTKMLNGFLEMKGNHDESSSAPTLRSSGGVQRPQIPQIQRLLQQKKYEEAFLTALNARSIDLITSVCKQLDPHSVFGGSQPLSQHVVLSLIQQLGFDLTKDTLTKLNWIREAALVLNINDRMISEHATIILRKVLDSLEELYPKFSHDPAVSQPFKLLMHVINSLLK